MINPLGNKDAKATASAKAEAAKAKASATKANKQFLADRVAKPRRKPKPRQKRRYYIRLSEVYLFQR